MRITIVMGFFLAMPPVAGGATEKSWQRLARAFARRGHRVTIISRRWPGFPNRETIDGVEHLRVRGCDHTPNLRRNLWRDFQWSLRVWRALPPADVTIVNCVALPALLGWTRGDAGKLVVMTGRMPKGQFRTYRRLDRVLAVSAPVRDAVRRENPRAAEKAIVVGYPIDCGRLERTGAPRPQERLTIGFVGRIHREKGLHLFAAALRELAVQTDLPPWRAIFCGPDAIELGGSGPEFPAELRRALEKSPQPIAFEFRPAIFDDDRLAQLYGEMDVFCYPSLASEGETFGVAVAEAMAAGAVPVVSSLACFGDFVRAGETGLVFDHTAPDAASRLAAALREVLVDPAARSRLAAGARAEVQRFDVERYAGRLLADFVDLK